MSQRAFKFILFVFAACTILLSGCSDFDEMQSDRLLSQAETLLQQGNEEQAEQAFADLVARYPETQSGEAASKQLTRIQNQREAVERAAFGKILGSYQQVLNGYDMLHAGYPVSLLALDESDYFFDTTYLEEITPEGYQVYLWLKDDGSDYRAWCVSQEKERGYAVEPRKRQLIQFDRDALLPKLQARYQADAWDGKLVALQGK